MTREPVIMSHHEFSRRLLEAVDQMTPEEKATALVALAQQRQKREQGGILANRRAP